MQAALGRALDNLYAQSRQLSTVDLTIKDIVSVEQSATQESCKVLLRIDVDFIGQKHSFESTIPYTAELTEQGNVLVTVKL